MTQSRLSQVSLDDTLYYHCTARCVRHAFLCGKDEFTGRDYEHRRQWIVDKLKELSSIFSIDVCAYAIMNNHYHVVLRVDVETATAWSEREVIERWTKLFSAPPPITRFMQRKTIPKAERVEAKKIIDQWRQRLIDISWYTRCLNESVARMANKEDGCKGRFWEGRFRSQALLDDSALLACMIYVDLNPVRVGIAKNPRKSDFTSAQLRLRHFSKNTQPANLLPFVDAEPADGVKGIAFALADYIALLNWTARAVCQDKQVVIPSKLKPIFEQLEFDEAQWLDIICNFGRRYRLAVGGVDKLRKLSERRGRTWLQGVGVSQQLYRTDESN